MWRRHIVRIGTMVFRTVVYAVTIAVTQHLLRRYNRPRRY
mgnify:FL=1